ncbi:glycoside hydrolase family 2 TIM barrel-domain containing protein [Mucilaginibacter paludis]|uniref:Glycoside hydrolase family 2 sugar binding n=1 Tax=Mucilaginibacter paludis DSM 18603 TaxID=714943 RepID=H1Y0W7_9SPHI|nr:glycoside hydrolase family 2 TIM barrel-domain containing protein [Mucilaginibacter paludis]EHQ29192.1 glycoside hydrolase family 2 sugar binding [Mucilaginibacter paludis DSM 18603]
MLQSIKNISFGLLLLSSVAAKAQTESARQTLLFDKDWAFIQSNATGAEKAVFDDSKWKKVNVPHDWSILGTVDHNTPSGRGGGFLPSGIGWYRKHFVLDAADAQKNVSIQFDGIMANSDVWINGYHLGKRPYGYISLNYDLTGHLNFGKGKINIIAVKADNSIQPASRYYTGAGIYRHVNLTITNPLHIQNWGLYITTPKVTADKATVHVQTTVVNDSKESKSFALKPQLIDAKGNTVSGKTELANHTLAAGKTLTIDEDIQVDKPELWDVENPVLYKAVYQVIVAGKVVDNQAVSFGIRQAQFDAQQGFLLNGKKVMIKGVCLHHDAGAVGAAVPLSVWERRLKLLKEVGVNGIRTSHNPVAPEFLDLCDRMGFLVMDENLDTWTAKKQHAENGYAQFFNDWWDKDTRDMVLRDRNHPSIVIYSVGNEIHDNLNDSTGFKKYRDLQNLVHQYDSSRPVTMALFRPAISKVYTNGLAAMMDVVGQNYRENELLAAHAAHPNWTVVGTENGHSLQAWLALRDHPFMAGQFLWTGVDYLGEADWPNVVNGQGLFDRTGGWRPLTYQRQSWWATQPVVHIVRKQENAGVGPVVADWTPTDFDTYDDARVEVYSNCDEVELFLNGKSLGSKPKSADDSPRDWNVTYEKGTIKAIGKNKGQEVASEELKTAGEPAKVILSADKAKIANSWDDVSYVTATIVDANGVPCPIADRLVTFSAIGAGLVTATDNGSLANQESMISPSRHTFNGKCVALIKANAPSGKIVVKATVPGLESGSVTIDVK